MRSPSKRPVTWMGVVVPTCDTCPRPIVSVFYDMKTKQGPWGCLCTDCAFHGDGVAQLGTGLGQRYEKQADGKWIKTGG